MRKETTAQRLDVMIEYKDCKFQIINMACPSDQNINENVREQLQK